MTRANFACLFAAGCLLLQTAFVPARAAEVRGPDLTWVGHLSGRDHQTYLEVPFLVPRGVERLTLEFSYSGKDQRTTLDLGLRDPVRFRGWSGGNKTRLVVEASDATPSYLSGPLPGGTWKLVIGVPNLRRGVTSDYTARVWFDRSGSDFPGFSSPSDRGAPGWYRGDLHAHTAHSDGSCMSSSGQRVPCPVFKTLQTAQLRKLDFIAITDHNAVSQNQALRELAPFFDTLLILPGREITTFQGHANVWGPTRDLDFQLGTKRAKTFNAILDQVHDAQGLVSINHPQLPSGEACMGCGWTAPTDWSKVDAIEVINGGSLAFQGAEGPMSGIPFWEHLLDSGYRITAVGGSDNHDPDLPVDRPGALGRPTTFVHAEALTQSALLDGIHRGRVFLDVAGLSAPVLEVKAVVGDQAVETGGTLLLRTGDLVHLTVSAAGLPPGATLSARGSALSSAAQRDWPAVSNPTEIVLPFGGAASWLRFDVRDPMGALILLGNPVYLRPAP